MTGGCTGSAGESTRHHPWRALRDLAEWTLHIAALPAGMLGLTDWPTRTITLAPQQTQAQRRATLTHELVHVERGPLHVQTPRVITAREEQACDQLAARRLIALDDLADALAWAHDEWELAEELWVDVATVRVRLAHLHPCERAHLNRRLSRAP